MCKNKGNLLYERAKKLIPGGTQLLSKRPEMFLPGLWPSYYKKCQGIEVWDLNGNKYLDFSILGVGACLLGYADADVDSAVIDAVKAGNMCTLNAPEEVELAGLLCELHPWAQMVRYARTGGEAMAVAARIVRAHTGKEKILFCGYHGWHDWYLSANLSDISALDGQLLPGLEPAGVPRGLSGTALPFSYNDIQGFESLVAKHKNKIAGVFMEPVRNVWPEKRFMEGIRQITKEKNIPLVFDEITSGFRMTFGGFHLNIDVAPDIAVFGKALGNGYPITAIIGKGEIMTSAQKTFISSTYWTDKIGPAAALAAINKITTSNVPSHLIKVGKQVQEGWKKLADKHGLEIKISGIYPLSNFAFAHEKKLVWKTLYTQLMLDKGFLASTIFFASYAHKKDTVDDYLTATDESFAIIAHAVGEKDPEKYLKGQVCHAGFTRLN